MRRSLSILKYFSLAFCIILLYFFLKDKDLAVIFDKVIGFNFVFFLLVTFLAYALATVGWRYSFVDFPRNVSFIRLFFIRLCGESFSIVNPTSIVGGEALKAYILKKRGIDYDEGLSSLLVSRILVMLSLLFLLLVSFFYLFDVLSISFGISVGLLEIVIILSLLLTLFFYVLYLSYKSRRLLSFPFIKLSSYFSSVKWLSSLTSRLLLLDEEFFRAVLALRFKLVWVFFLNMLHWLCGAFEIYLILYFLGFSWVSFFDSFLMEMGITLFKFFGSFVPGQVGFEEYGNKFMLDLVSLGGESFGDTWVAFSILRRARQVFWVFLGIIILPFFLGRSDLASLKEGG